MTLYVSYLSPAFYTFFGSNFPPVTLFSDTLSVCVPHVSSVEVKTVAGISIVRE
jgi:hypothetical protein